MNEGGFFLDTREFDKNFRKLTTSGIPLAYEKGLFNAMNELLRDSIIEAPQAPFKKGDLHGSRIVEKTKKGKGESTVKGGFNISYAMRQHEVEPGTYHYTLTNVKNPGPKYMESKMIKNKEKYMKIIAETIKDSRL